jgi:hypothetical protein
MADEPLRTTTFLLTTADALAYEQAAGRVSPLGILALLLWLGLWGSAALLLPPDWAGPRIGWTFSLLVSVLVAIAYVLALLLLSVRQWLRARRRMKRPTELTLSEWPDRLDVIGGGLMPRDIAFAEIRRHLSTKAHLFLETDEEVLILPRRAFPEVGAFEALAARIAGTPRPEQPPDDAA